MTAGQAFVAFVLLLLSLAASFAFGLMIGKGQADERLVVRKDPEIVNEAAVVPIAKKQQGKIVELGVPDDEFQVTETSVTDTAVTPPVIIEESGAAGASPAESTPTPADASVAPQVPAPTAPAVPHFAQLLSTGDQKTAEAMAAKLIDRGFESAYVERGATDKGPIFRVRVKFASESEARAAEPKLKEFSKEVWITK